LFEPGRVDGARPGSADLPADKRPRDIAGRLLCAPSNATSGTRLGPQEARIMGRRLLRRRATRAVDRSRFLTSTDESANGIRSQLAPSGAARADDYLKEEETK
jgi:hypothetical protein